MLERPGVPDDVVEGRLPYPGEPRLVAEGGGYRALEVGTFEARGGDVLPALGEPDVPVVEGEAPLAVEVRPVLAAELRARVLGTRYGVHGCSPLPRSERWASGQYSRPQSPDGPGTLLPWFAHAGTDYRRGPRSMAVVSAGGGGLVLGLRGPVARGREFEKGCRDQDAQE